MGGHRIYNSNSGKVGTMRHQTHTVLFLLICLATQAKLSEIVEGSGDEEFDQDAAINEAVNKVTELVTSWADNLEDIDMDLEINQMENEVTDEKAGKRKRKCEKCERKIFRARNSEFCESCQEEETVEVTTALTTPQSSISQSLIQNLKLNHNHHHHHNHRLVQKRRRVEIRCQKCTKNSFRARNENFCSTKCSLEEDNMEKEKTTIASTTTPTTTTTTTTTTSPPTTTEMMTTTTETNKKVARCLARCSRRPENMKWTEKCNMRCEKIAAQETEENENNTKRKRNKKTKKQKEDKNQDSLENVAKKGPLETFIKFLFKRS